MERTLLVGLLISSVLNTTLLIVMVIAILRFVGVLGKLAGDLQGRLDRSEQELAATMTATRETAVKVGDAVTSVVRAAERYLLLSALRPGSGSGRWSRLFAGIGAGVDLVRALGLLGGRERSTA